jgi:hypothetical protein
VSSAKAEPSQEPQYSGPGEVVVWPAGTLHRWWNAGDGKLLTSGAISPPLNYEFFLGTVFASAKEHGGRPGIFDAAFIMTRYRTEHAMVEMPSFVRRVALPVVYVIGRVLGKYAKYKDAPEAMTPAPRATAAGVAERSMA